MILVAGVLKNVNDVMIDPFKKYGFFSFCETNIPINSVMSVIAYNV